MEAYEPSSRGPLVAKPANVEVLIDNVRSVFNVGSVFRSAEGAGIGKIHLGGISPTPKHPKMAKTALGAELRVPWAYGPDATEIADRLQADGYALWALEPGANAVDLFASAVVTEPTLLIIGNEVTGIDPSILFRCDRRAAIPMAGQNGSLNVATAFGIAAYAAILGVRNTGTRIGPA